MEILKRKNTKRRKIIILIIAAVAVAGGVFAYLYLTKQPSQTSSAEPTESTEQSAKSSTSTTSTSTENSSTTSSNSPTKDVVQYSGENNNSTAANSGGVSVTAVQANSTVLISTVINNLWSEGACSVTITNGSASIIKTANIQPMPSYSTCQGFSIPTSDLGVGTWSIKLTVTHASQTLIGAAEVVVQ